MQILIVDHYYPAFLDSFYKSHPEVNNLNYQSGLQALIKENFGTSDFYSHALSSLGHSTNDIIVNARALQESWAKEHKLPPLSSVATLIDYSRSLSSFWSARKASCRQEQILATQIKYYHPDVLYIHNISYLSASFIRQMKKHVQLVVGQLAAPIPPLHNFSHFDLIISSLPSLVSEFRRRGIDSEYLPLSFDERVLKQVDHKERPYPLTFVGSFFGMHGRWLATLKALAADTPLKVWGSPASALSDPTLQDIYQGEAWGNDMYRILSSSQITINRHSNIAGNFANNMRLFEATGCGALLLTDQKYNLSDFFEVGKEVVAYDSPQDLKEKVQYYLSHKVARDRLALAGQARTLRDHTYTVRMRQLITILERYL